MGRQVIDWCDRCGKVISRRQDAVTITWTDMDFNKNWDLCDVCKDELKKWLYVQPTFAYDIRVTKLKDTETDPAATHVDDWRITHG